MRRNRSESKNPHAALHRLVDSRPALTQRLGQCSPPSSLHHVFDESPKHLTPGDIIVLNESQILRSQVELDFFAVLACPRCGVLDLITTAQYFGGVPVICGSNTCSCSFRIEDESRIVYLPLN